MYQAARDFFFGKDKPLPEAVEWHQRNRLTPDIWKLEQSQFQLIFVPDMKGSVGSLITEAARDGDTPVHPSCFTLERFTLWKKDLGVESFGIPMERTYQPSNWVRVRPEPAKIKGQLFAILSPQIKKLDIHRQNGVEFRRVRQKITLPYFAVKYSTAANADIGQRLPKLVDCIHTVDAWMYVGIPEYWDDRIGDMFQIRECNQFEFNLQKFWCDRFYKFE